MARQNASPDHRHEYGIFMEQGDVVDEGANGGVQRTEKGAQNGQASQTAIYNPFYTGRPRTPTSGSKSASIDRQEIIRKIKSGGSRAASPELERPSSRLSSRKRKSPGPEQQQQQPIQLMQVHKESQDPTQSTEDIGLQIERPRSALHRGDFREKDSSIGTLGNFSTPARDEPTTALSTSPVVPWHRDFPQAAFRQPWPARQVPSAPPGLPVPSQPARARAASTVSLASSFVYKPPTSPLVQASRPDTPEPGLDRRSRSPDKDRRRTFSPQSFQKFRSSPDGPGASHFPWRPTPTLRSEATFPYQAHQPRRSINAFGSVPHSPSVDGRRPSLSDSPLHLAPMVGSYEESILRGRMSTTPSKPLNFVAQIGVLGKGDCKPSLRCPPHATVPFPAVFYSYGAGAKGTNGDQPSPYVGLIDLENNLPTQPPSPEKRRQRLQASRSNEGSRASSHTREESAPSDVQTKHRKRQRRKQRRRSGSPKAPPGGSYRIPQQGQIQVIIKNPNKTAVKLFLIPYDLSDMDPGQKTFVRQRSYSAGPIIDMPLSSRKNLGTDRPEAALNASDDPNERPMLRYLVHLHICCPAKGRYFLYKAIRVVFANRVPDGKENLRNEIQLPEPRYSAYKASRDSGAAGANVNGTTSSSSTHSRRRSVQDAKSLHSAAAHEHLPWPHQQRSLLAQSLPSAEYNPDFNHLPSMQPIPFHLSSALPTLESRPGSRQMSDGMDVDSEGSSREAFPSRGPGRGSGYPAFALPSKNLEASLSTTAVAAAGAAAAAGTLPNALRIEEGEFDFERERSCERAGGIANGRSELSRRLKDLAFQAQSRKGGES